MSLAKLTNDFTNLYEEIIDLNSKIDSEESETEELYRTIGNQNVFDKYSDKKKQELTCRDVYLFC
jgi:hypothetical protein